MDSHGKRIPNVGYLNIAGMEKLIRLLTRLKHHGFQNLSSDYVWDDITQTGTLSHSPQYELCRLRRSLDEAKLCMTMLNDARSHLERRIQFLQKNLSPLILEDAVKNLPNELLSHVFEAGHHMTNGCAFVKSVSWVSHRFRQVALRTPLLWTRISARYSDDQVEAFLSRSGLSGLEISTWCICGESRLQTFLQSLQPASNRVLQLRLGFRKNAEIVQKSGLTAFPYLRILDVSHDIDLSKWHLPRLSQFRGANLPGGFPFQAKLTIVDVFFDAYVDLASLSQALDAMTSLRDLSLTLMACVGGYSMPITQKRVSHSVHIENLRIAIQDLTPRTVTALLYDTLHILSPSTVEIALDNLADEHPPRFLYNSAGQVFPYGSTIKIRISDLGNPHQDWEEFALLPTLVLACNIVHTVHINAPVASILYPRNTGDADEDWSTFAPLRHLQLRYCDQLTLWEISLLVDKLVFGTEAGMNLKSLEILSCRGISEDFLLELSGKVGPKLTWKA